MITLQYYFVKNNNIEHVIFDNYTIDENGIIINKKTGVDERWVSNNRDGSMSHSFIQDVLS